MSISKGRVARRSDRYGLRRRDDGADAPERPPSLAEHVCRVIREDILTGRQPAGARLTEAIVMERTGVSRTPVREGLRTLEGEGLVITYRSRGTFVTYRLTADEARLLYDVRLVLEPHLARLGAERMTPERAGLGRGRAGAVRRGARRRRGPRGWPAGRRLPPGDLRGRGQRAAQRAARLLEPPAAGAVRARLQRRGPAPLPRRAPGDPRRAQAGRRRAGRAADAAPTSSTAARC